MKKLLIRSKNNILSLFIFCLISCLTNSLSANGVNDLLHQHEIPLVAHFVYGLWDTKPMPQLYQDNLQAWKRQGWKIKLWMLPEVEQLLNLPQFEEYKITYKMLRRNIQKADFIRYLIVFNEGGFYFDLDCKPTSQSLFKYCGNSGLAEDVFFLETITSKEFAQQTASLYPIRRGIPEGTIRIANFAFGGKRKSKILENILKLTSERCKQNPVITEDYDVIYTTGPDCVSEIVNNSSQSYRLIKNTDKFMHHICTGAWRNGTDVDSK